MIWGLRDGHDDTTIWSPPQSLVEHIEKFCVAPMEFDRVYKGQNCGYGKVGIKVGREEGSIVGKTDGNGVVGTAVGIGVGITVGIAVEGKAEGTGVGDKVRLNLVAIKRPVQAALPTQPW